jgi:hypothetical protein
MAVQRRQNWTPLIVSNREDRTDGETKVDQTDDPIGGGLALGDSTKAADAGTLSRFPSDGEHWARHRR